MHTINDVIARLEAILNRAYTDGSRLGYFAALYLHVTRQVKAGMDDGRFEDSARMERFDVVFAKRYFDAYDCYLDGRATTQSWRVCFDVARRHRPLALQQLLLAMNAHINLDLGIAAAETAPGASLARLRGDFDEINTILAEQLDVVQNRVNQFSPLMRLVDVLSGRTDEAVFQFRLMLARRGAWELAESLAELSGGAWRDRVTRRDEAVVNVAQTIVKPPALLRAGAFIAGLVESRDVRHNLDAMLPS